MTTKKPAAKKVVKKVVPAKKPAAKKVVKKPAAPAKAKLELYPVDQKLTKTDIIAWIAEDYEVDKAAVKTVLAALDDLILGSLCKKGVGEFTLPGICKFYLRATPARKAGTLVRNPATGEMMKGAAKPASVRVKVRPLAKIKQAAVQ